jgi:hypothetical protein
VSNRDDTCQQTAVQHASTCLCWRLARLKLRCFVDEAAVFSAERKVSREGVVGAASPSQFNREGSLQVLCRLAAREERQERLLRIIGPHSLREHVILKFHCLLQLFA